MIRFFGGGEAGPFGGPAGDLYVVLHVKGNKGSDALASCAASFARLQANEHDQLGDISTLADPSVVQQLIEDYAARK